MKFTYLILCYSMLFTACNSTKNSQQKHINHELEGEYIIKSVNTASLTNNELTINFNDAEKRISGHSGCNNFFGNYNKDQNTLQFNKIGATRKLCPEAMKVERELLDTLNKIRKISFDNKQIINLIGENDNTIMTLEKSSM